MNLPIVVSRKKLRKWRKLLGQILSVQRPSATQELLNDELGQWTRDDLYLVSDLLKSVSILGATGSGKSSGPLRYFAKTTIRHPRSTCLIHCAKPRDVEQWQRDFRDAGREGDLVVFEPGGNLRFNVLNYLVQSGADAQQVTKGLMSIGQSLRSGGMAGREGGEFWDREEARNLYNGIVPLKLATGKVGGPELQEFITTAALSAAELDSEQWRRSLHSQCLEAAVKASKSPIEKHDLDNAIRYWLVEFPNMADRTRSSILVGVLGLLHQFNTGEVRQLLSTDTNVTPADMLDRGKSIAVNAPPSVYGDTGNFINAAWKFATQWSVLRRNPQASDFFNVIFCDEAPQFFNDFDADYLAQCREYLGCMVFCSQSSHSYYAALPGDAGKHKVDSLLGNFNLKVYCALASHEDAEKASNSVGRELRTFFGGSVAPPEGGMWEQLMGQPKVTGSFNTNFENILEPRVFMHGLRTGGAANRYVVDAVIVKTGKPFADGRNWMWTSFSQR